MLKINEFGDRAKNQIRKVPTKPKPTIEKKSNLNLDKKPIENNIHNQESKLGTNFNIVQPLETISSLENEVRTIKENNDLSLENKKKLISKLILEKLNKVGTFYCLKGNDCYYIDKKENQLYKIKSEDFTFFIRFLTGINHQDSLHRFIIAEVQFYCKTKGQSCQIYNTSHWDSEKKTLYLFDNQNHIFKIGDFIERVSNGTDGVLFIKKSAYERINYLNLNNSYFFNLLSFFFCSKRKRK